MRKFLLNQNILKKLTLAAMLMVFFATNAQLKKSFVPRYSETINGDFTMIANNILSRHATNSYNGQESNHDFFDNVFVDIDNDPTTFNSSSASLSNPASGNSCLTIRKAYLYWAAADKEYEIDGSGNIIAGNGGSEVSWNFDEVKLMLPGSTDYDTTLTADEVIYRGRDEHFANDPYICVKDITNQVQALSNPFGKYQIANIKATEGSIYEHSGSNTGTSGGWQIVFVYQSPALVEKNITLFDGYAHISNIENNFDVTFDGFQTVPNGNVNANMVMGSLEGDRGLMQDRLLIYDTNGVWEPLSTNLRDENNFFNSSITVNGSDFLDRSPASTNTLGYDAALFNLDNNANRLITNNQTSAVIRMTSDQEVYGLYLLGLSVEVWEPLLNTLDLYSSASSENVGASDSILIYLDVANTGNDNIRNLSFTTIIPEEFDFINTESLPNEITYTYDHQTRELTFAIEDGFTDIASAPYTIRYTIKVKDESYFNANTSCSFNSEQQTIASYNGEINPTQNTAYSSFTFDECGIGNMDPTLIAINIIDTMPPVFVEEVPLDMMVECDAVPDAIVLTAIDNCDSNPEVTFEETATNNRDCSQGYEITRTWEATDDVGNMVTHTQIIIVNRDMRCDIDNIIVSKTITANGDGINDVFEITNLEGCGYIFQVKIFNRWGNMIYESNDYQNDWGGNSPDNSMGGSGMLPSGTYYYIIGFNTPELKPINGYIYIGSN